MIPFLVFKILEIAPEIVGSLIDLMEEALLLRGF